MKIQIKTNANTYSDYIAELSKIFLSGLKKYDRTLDLGIMPNGEDDSSELRRSLYFAQKNGPALVIIEGSNNSLSKPWKLRFSTFEIDGGKLHLVNRVTYEFAIKDGKIEASVLNEESYKLNAVENIVVVNSVDQLRRESHTALPQAEIFAEYKKLQELAYKTAKAYNSKHGFFGPFAELYTKLGSSVGVKVHSNSATLNEQPEIKLIAKLPSLRKEKRASLPKPKIWPLLNTINSTVTFTPLNLFECIDGMQMMIFSSPIRMQKVYFKDAKLTKFEIYIGVGERAQLVKSSTYEYTSDGKQVKIRDQVKDGVETKALEAKIMPYQQFIAMAQNTISDVIAKAKNAVNPKDKAISKDIARTYAADLQIRQIG